MSRLLEIQERLQDTDAAIATMEKAIAEDPHSPSLQLMAASLQKQQRRIEAEFLAVAAEIGIDVCAYRLFGEQMRPTLRGLTSVLGDFQSLFSIAYDALRSGPKRRAKFSQEVTTATSFGFGYTFAGSLGVVLTLPNERPLFGETQLDESMQAVFSMAKAQNPDEVVSFARRFGVASVRAAFQWARDHVQFGLGADIEWRRDQDVRAKLFIQQPELARLQEAIAATSEETTEAIVQAGELIGVDVKQKTFHLRFPDGDEIRGSFVDAVSHTQSVTIPRFYKATLTKITRIQYSTEDEKTDYFLQRLEPAG